MRTAALHVGVLLVLQALCASGAEPGGQRAVPSDEVSKQSSIYRSRGEEVPAGYVVDRSLLSYAFTLGPELTRSLASLGSKDRWLDVGAGEGRAVLDYSTEKYDALFQGHRRGAGRAKAVAMSIEDRRTTRWHNTAASLAPAQVEYFFGRRLREYSLEELGQFEVITDVIGGFSYTRYLSVFMEKALGFLTANGHFYTVLQDVRTEAGTNRPYYPDARFLTEIADAGGVEVKVCSWLKSITCVEVTCEAKADRVPPIEVYRIRKTCDGVKVPPLELAHFEAGTPPERRFRLSTPASPAAGGGTPLKR
jgi:hypothetical protein